MEAQEDFILGAFETLGMDNLFEILEQMDPNMYIAIEVSGKKRNKPGIYCRPIEMLRGNGPDVLYFALNKVIRSIKNLSLRVASRREYMEYKERAERIGNRERSLVKTNYL